jgi:hypothetical protein
MMAQPQPMVKLAAGLARQIARVAEATSTVAKGHRLMDVVNKELVDDIFAHSLKKQTGVSLKYMLDFGANPIERQLLLSAQFLHKELPVRLAHRVAELENLPYGLSAKSSILKVSRVLGGSDALIRAHCALLMACLRASRLHANKSCGLRSSESALTHT